jgi:hypothetical protein
MVTRKWALRIALFLGVLTSSISLSLQAQAIPLPSSPFTIADTGGGFVSLYPFGGNPQVDFAPISGGGALAFRLELISNDPIPPDSVNLFISLRLDFGGALNPNPKGANITGPNLPGTIDYGVFESGTIQLANITSWGLLLPARPDTLSMTYFADFGVPSGVTAVLYIEQTPIPGTLPLFAGGLGVVGFLAMRRRKQRAA